MVEQQATARNFLVPFPAYICTVEPTVPWLTYCLYVPNYFGEDFTGDDFGWWEENHAMDKHYWEICLNFNLRGNGNFHTQRLHF